MPIKLPWRDYSGTSASSAAAAAARGPKGETGARGEKGETGASGTSGHDPWIFGTGSPEGVVTGYVGQQYKDTDSGDGFVKMSGDGTNTGWI